MSLCRLVTTRRLAARLWSALAVASCGGANHSDAGGHADADAPLDTAPPLDAATPSDADTPPPGDAAVDAPAAGEYPSATNTGPLPALGCGPLEDATPETITEDRAGLVIANKRFADGFQIYARNVTLRCCEVVGSGADIPLIYVREGADGFTAENCSIHGASTTEPTAPALSILANHATVRRTNLSLGSAGLQLDGDDLLVEDNYVHDLLNFGDEHTAGVTSRAGHARVTIRHNAIENRFSSSAALALYHDDAPTDPATAARYADVLVERNLVSGGSYAINAGGTASGGLVFAASNVQFVGNEIGTRFFPQGGEYGPVMLWPPAGSGYSWEENTWHDGPNAGRTLTP